MLVGVIQVVRIKGRLRLHWRSGITKETQLLRKCGKWSPCRIQQPLHKRPCRVHEIVSFHLLFSLYACLPSAFMAFSSLLLFLSLSLPVLVLHTNLTNRGSHWIGRLPPNREPPIHQSSQSRFSQSWLHLWVVAIGSGSNLWKHLQ